MSSGGSPVSQTRVLLGLILGAALGSLMNSIVTEGTAVLAVGEVPTPRHLAAKWLAENAVGPVLPYLIKYVAAPVGSIFLNLLFFAIVPLVFASLAVGVTRLGGTANVGRVGAKTMAYFLVTTACAAFLGLSAVNLIQPGHRLPEAQRIDLVNNYPKGDADAKVAGLGIETLINVVPKNPLKAFVEKDMLAIIFSAILVGVALTRIDPDKAALLTKFLEGVNQVTDFVIRLAMAMAPYAVFALIFQTTAVLGYQVLVALGAYVVTVLLGLAVHQFVVLPVLVSWLGGRDPLDFYRKIRVVMLTAFSTSSSSATLPVAMKCAEDDLGVPEGVSRFVLPLSASMNHNGTALFEGVTVIFLAQLFNVDLSLGQQLIVLVLCILTATGMAGVPGGSLPLIGIILVTATDGKVPAGAIAIITGVDRLLDMCRTTVNVTADMTTAVFVARSEASRAAVTAGTAPSGSPPTPAAP